VGVRPKDDAEGVLQDIRWSRGEMSYFPTYSLGNVIAGVLFQQIQKDVDVGAVVARGELTQVKTWLMENIHKFGSTYSPKELQRKLFDEANSPQPLVKYLEQKYLPRERFVKMASATESIDIPCVFRQLGIQ